MTYFEEYMARPLIPENCYSNIPDCRHNRIKHQHTTSVVRRDGETHVSGIIQVLGS